MKMNTNLIELLNKLENIEKSRGKIFESRAYSKAADSIINFNKPINSLEEIKDLKNIGTKIYKKFQDYIKNNTLPILEEAKNDPVIIFHNIYGIGPKKAIELVNKEKITSIKQLRENQHLLNDKQKIGLKYYEDLLERIPREEINKYNKLFKTVFDKIKTTNDFFEIVGSYRRGAETSGDIDIILSNKKNNREILNNFIEELKKQKILIEILSKGKTKSLTIAQLTKTSTPRRIDFMYSPPDEFAFATLYFTGSKNFNVVQRKIANDQNLTLNEHGFSHLSDTKIKQNKLIQSFPNEKSIFDYLNMVYKEPQERIDGTCAILKSANAGKNNSIKGKKTVKIKNKTLKGLKKMSERKNIIKNWKELEDNGITSANGFSENDIYKMLTYASKAYYNENKPIVSDEIFDILKEYANKKYPSNKKFNEIGAEITKKKIKLPYYLASMDKIKPDTNALNKYLMKYPNDKIISGKADGISVLYTTEKETPLLATRGQATNGLDISYMIPHLNLPKNKNIAIRGELIISKKKFNEKYSKEYKNPRNFISGIVNSKKLESDKWKDITFLGYEVIKPILKPSKQFEWLENNNVDTIIHKKFTSISNKLLSDYLVKWRDSYDYEIDGIIVTDDNIYPRKNENPKHSLAFKMVLGDQVAEAKIIDVIWTTSKDHFIKPVAQIEPVNLKGVTIEHVTAFNAKYVNDNNIGVGSVIELVRSGDVIPHINKIIKKASKPKMPDIPWHWNKTNVDAISDVKDDPSAIQKSIEFFFKKLDIKGVGPGNVAKLIKFKFDTIPKILSLTKKEMLSIDGFKEKTVEKIYNNIHTTIDNASLVQIASASNIFKRGIGSSIIKNILDDYPDIFETEYNKDALIEKIALVDNISKKRAEQFVEYIPEFIEFIKNSKLQDKFKNQNNQLIDKNNPLFNKKIVFSGPRDKTLQDKLLEKGAKITSSVSKNTFALLIENNTVGSNKVSEAKKHKIPIMTFEKFKDKYL